MNTSALARPAAKRSAGHVASNGSAMPSVRSPVPTRPTRTSVGASTAGQRMRAQSIGCTVHIAAPLR